MKPIPSHLSPIDVHQLGKVSKIFFKTPKGEKHLPVRECRLYQVPSGKYAPFDERCWRMVGPMGEHWVYEVNRYDYTRNLERMLAHWRGFVDNNIKHYEG